VEQLTDSQTAAKRELWKASFVEEVRTNTDFFRETYRASVSKNSEWLDRMDEVLNHRLPYEVSSGQNSLAIYEAYRDLVNTDRQYDDVRTSWISKHPDAVYEFADRALDVLSASPGALSEADRKWRRSLDKAVRDGNIPSPRGTLDQIANAAPGGAVARLVGDQLRGQLTQNQGALEARIGSVDSLTAVVLNTVLAQQEKIDSLSHQLRKVEGEGAGEAARRRAAQVTRDSLILETRAGINVAASLIGLIDPRLGEDIGVAGDAAMDASVAIGSLMEHGFTFAASGNLLGAGIQLAGLLQKRKPDAATLRHQQLVRMLAEIGEQLVQVRRTLAIVDAKLDAALLGIEEVRKGQLQQTEIVLAELGKARDQLLVAVARGRYDVTEQYFIAHQAERRRCETNLPLRGPWVQPQTESGRLLNNCLSNYITYGTDISRTAAFTNSDFRWGVESPAAFVGRDAVHYLPTFPAIVEELRIASGTPFPAFTLPGAGSLSHPEVVAQAIQAFIELRLRQPRFAFASEQSILRSLQHHLVRYETWSKEAYGRIREGDGGGLVAFERAKADVQMRVREFEDRHLARQTVPAALPAYCAMALRTADSSVVNSCVRGRPRLTDRLDGVQPIELLRFALYHGRAEPVQPWSWGPPEYHAAQPSKRPLANLRTIPYVGVWNGYYSLDFTPCVYRHPTFVRNAAPQPDTLFRGVPTHLCERFRGQHGKNYVYHLRDKHLSAMRERIVQPFHAWTPDTGQRWMQDVAYARGRTDEIMRPGRAAFALALVDSLRNGRAPTIEAAMERLDRVQAAWMFYDRLALGSCYGVAESNYEAAQSGGWLISSTNLRKALADADLLGFMRQTDALSLEAKQKMPVAQPPHQGLCERVPSYIAEGISAVDRYLDLRRAAGGS
jgi:hypothetical protein